MNKTIYNVGLDVGSTTVKIAVIDNLNNIVHKEYKRHNAKVREAISQLLESFLQIHQDCDIRVNLTGSAGLGVAQEAHIPFNQEVISCTTAVKHYYPKANVAIELGGEDAKVIFFGNNIEQRMNGTCAGGTGAFIDQMATLLDIDITELNELAKDYKIIYPIASRCGVFAKTDIQPLINQGAAKADIAISILQAIVNQTLAGLAQGRKIISPVIFLGGPLYFLSELQKAFQRTLKLSPEEAIFPENAHYFVALGCALNASESEVVSLSSLIAKLALIQEPANIGVSNPLFNNQAEYNEFKARQDKNDVKRSSLKDYKGKIYLGIDAGSTTTKIVLIGENKELLHEYYDSNKGSPLKIIKDELLNINTLLNKEAKIVSSCVTGYGEELIKEALQIDFGVVETYAHYKAAKYFNPKVSYIIDIGGQDMKCFKVVNDAIDSIMLNEACSSGCGSFIETFSKSLGYEVGEFAKLALFAKHPASLGTRCTVFMNSSIKQAQKEGATVEDLAAGIATSVVKNALYKVIRIRNIAELGDQIVVQGGTFYNDAVLRAFEQETKLEVIRPVIARTMGAFGCALLALEQEKDATKNLDFAKLENFECTSKSINCGLCTNKCLLTISTFNDGRRYISGNKCERGAGLPTKDNIPNAFASVYKRLYALPITSKPTRGELGIPMVLNFYDTLPFWVTFFNSLGIKLVLSGPTTKEIYFSGQQTIPSDTVCYPAKVAHGHIEQLLEKGLTKIFYPISVYNFKEKKYVDNHYNCPVVAYYPELLRNNMDNLESIDYIIPYVVPGSKLFVQRIFDSLVKHYPDININEIKQADKLGHQAYKDFREQTEVESLVAIQYARKNNLPIIVLAGRPYHLDTGINHSIDKLLVTLNCVVIPEQGISYLNGDAKLKILNQWTYHARLYDAAYYIINQKDMQLVQLVSFGCGIDAITTDETRRILEENGKLYTQIKIDEITNLGSAKIRLRTLLSSIKARGEI